MKQPKIVLVRWIDQNRFHGWQHADALKKDVLPLGDPTNAGPGGPKDVEGINAQSPTQ